MIIEFNYMTKHGEKCTKVQKIPDMPATEIRDYVKKIDCNVDRVEVLAIREDRK